MRQRNCVAERERYSVKKTKTIYDSTDYFDDDDSVTCIAAVVTAFLGSVMFVRVSWFSRFLFTKVLES